MTTVKALDFISCLCVAAILDKFGLFLALDDARQLMMKFDYGSNTGLFNYCEFLRHYILTLKPQDDGLLQRRKLHASKVPVSQGYRYLWFKLLSSS